MKRVVTFSYGVQAWACAKRVVERYGTDGLVLLNADTKSEDPDTYRFGHEAAANVGGQLVEIADGRNIWEVFRDVRMLGGGKMHADPCSRILKRELIDRWLEKNCDPADTIVYVGLDWSEGRFERLRDIRAADGWRYEAPLCDPPYLTKDDMHEWATREGLAKQRLYVLGMSHANCGGGCVKMGQGGFAHLLKVDPCMFAEWEANEQTLREQLGDVAILRDRRGGTSKPLTLRALRQRIERDESVDMFDIGGCGCFVDATKEEGTP